MLSAIFGPDIIIVVLLAGIIGFGLSIWAVVDAATRPDNAWIAAGQSKVLWIVLIIGLTIFTPFGFVVAIVYLTNIRSKVSLGQSGNSSTSNSGFASKSTCLNCGTSIEIAGAGFCPTCGAAV